MDLEPLAHLLSTTSKVSLFVLDVSEKTTYVPGL